MQLSKMAIGELEVFVREGRKIWCVGYDNEVFESEVLKVWQIPFCEMYLTVRNEEQSKSLEFGKAANSTQRISLCEAWTTKEEAILFVKNGG